MTIRYLNCLTIRPYIPWIVGGVTCLLVETNQGLVLVDSGVGTRDYESKGLMRLFLRALRAGIDRGETALEQITRLGYKPEDVRHIIQTHLHLDHAGGLPDFPQAQVHVHRKEYEALQKPSGWSEWFFLRQHFAHSPKWVLHEQVDSTWEGLDAIQIAGIEPRIYMIPLFGHTPGHCGVVVDDGERWVFLAGDAVPFNLMVDEVPDWISRLIIGPHVPRLREFMKKHPEVKMAGAHMTLDFYEKIPSQRIAGDEE
jgi:glyoxylase-like metal-dependent hydrolase (beta-lactamase superfamily II)